MIYVLAIIAGGLLGGLGGYLMFVYPVTLRREARLRKEARRAQAEHP